MNISKTLVSTLFILGTFIGCAGSDETIERKPTRILIIGNSLSYTHDIPSLLELIGAQQSVVIKAECLCKPNYALIDHWNDGTVQHYLNQTKYDYVLMQQGPSSQQEGRQLLLDYGKKIVELAKKKDVAAAFYMVWPSVAYDHTFEGVIESYTLAALETNSLLAPVGEVWKEYQIKSDDKSLYSSDLFHPSRKGSFLAAWVIFHALFDDQNTSYTTAYQSYMSKAEFALMNEVMQMVLARSTLSAPDLFQLASAAYKAGNYSQFLLHLLKVDQIRPNHPTVLYNLALAYTLTGQSSVAIKNLTKALWINASLPFQTNEVLDTLAALPDYQKLKSLAEELNSEIRIGSDAFNLEDAELHPEGLAYHAASESFYISSIRKGIVLKIDKNGSSSVFARAEPIQSIMGLQVDDKEGALWATSVTTPNLKDSVAKANAALLRFDLESGELVRRYESPNDDDWLGDLILSSRGDVLVSNSSAAFPSIYKLNKETSSLEVFLESSELSSLQGLAFNKNESKLFFSDYRHGLFVLDLKSAKLAKVENNTPHPFKAVDGLYYWNKSLIAMHNGTRPFRVVRYTLNRTENRITSFEFLEKALPEMNEPTLGAIIGNEFYYIVNSPWGAYDQENNFLQEKADKPVVRVIKLMK